MERIKILDCYRGIVILLMIIYHAIFDLIYLGFLYLDLSQGILFLFQRTIAISFILISGISIYLMRKKYGDNYYPYIKKGAFLLLIGIGITVFTNYIYPIYGAIFFGIIHFMAISVLIAPLFFRFGKLNILLALVLIFIGLNLPEVENHYLFPLGLSYPGFYTLDYYPLLPWFGVTLLGLGLAEMVNFEKIRLEPNGIVFEWLGFLSRNSLIIYLVHQPIIFGVLFLLRGQ